MNADIFVFSFSETYLNEFENFLISITVYLEMEEHVVVTVAEGKLKGKTGIDHFGGKYYSFRGVPYAKPPLNDLRFKVNS